MSSYCCTSLQPTEQAGAIMPLAYLTETTSQVVLDAAVTVSAPIGTVVYFRFYPRDQSWLSPLSSSVSFTITAPLFEGSFVRLRRDGATDMVLEWRVAGGTWAVIGRALSRPNIPRYASCLIAWAPSVQSSVLYALSFIGFSIVGLDGPFPPPTCTLACKYVVVQPTYPSPGGVGVVYEAANVANRSAVPGEWHNVWQLLKWGNAWTAVATEAGWVAIAEAAEDALYVALQPGQLTVLAYRPHLTSSPSFAAELVVVTTGRVSPSTTVYIWANNWSTTATPATANWTWVSPPVALPAGTTVDMRGLSSNPAATPTASVGTLTLTNLPSGNVTAFTLYTTASTHPAVAITGLYPCSYTGLVPTNLYPGINILSRPWPDCATILAIPSCRPVCDWPAYGVQLANSGTNRWLQQPVPSFRACALDICACGGCGQVACSSAFMNGKLLPKAGRCTRSCA